MVNGFSFAAAFRRIMTAALPLALAAACIAEPETPQRAEFLIPVPRVLQPVRSDATGDYYEMTEREAMQQLLPGVSKSAILGYDGQWPGPTIVARRGRPVSLTLKNELDRPVSTHNHGHKVEANSDGHPADLVLPGTQKTYVYPNDQGAATYFYHDHTMGTTGRNVWWGLAGAYVITDPEEDKFNFPSGEYDIPLLIQDRKFNGAETSTYIGAPTKFKSDMNMSYGVFGGGFGNVPCVNGVCSHVNGTGPVLEVARRKYRFRLVNGSDQRVYRLQLLPGSYETTRDEQTHPFWVIGSDQGLLPQAIRKKSIVIGPGERYDVVVDFGFFPVGTTLQVINTQALGQPLRQFANVMKFKIVKEAEDPSNPKLAAYSRDVLELPKIERLDPATAILTRDIEFSQFETDANDIAVGAGTFVFTLNGKEFDPGRIDYRAKLGTTEIWRIKNPTIFTHTFHIHLSKFQLLDINGSPPSEELTGWKDTVSVLADESATFIVKWEGFSGVYPFHCHVLGHEDHHMMGQIEVTE
jgi:spore coat protein A